MSTSRRRRLLVEEGGSVGLAGAQQMVDDPQQRAGQDGEGLLLAPAAIEEALVADTPLGRAPGGDEGCQIERMAQRTGATFGEALLTDERAALAGARVKARIGDDFIDPT